MYIYFMIIVVASFPAYLIGRYTNRMVFQLNRNLYQQNKKLYNENEKLIFELNMKNELIENLKEELFDHNN